MRDRGGYVTGMHAIKFVSNKFNFCWEKISKWLWQLMRRYVVKGQVMGYSGSLDKVIRFTEEDPINDITWLMCTVRNTPLKIVRRGKVLDFVCRWLIEVKVKISENNVFFFFQGCMYQEDQETRQRKRVSVSCFFLLDGSCFFLLDGGW